MTLKLQDLIVTSLVLLSLFSFNSCKKTDDIGLELRNPSDKLEGNYIDTLTVISYTGKSDSLSTKGLVRNVLGDHKDATFGRTIAAINTQLRLPGNSVSFDAAAVIDSVVLSMKYNGFYGDSTSTFTAKVYELSEELHKDSIYYASHRAAKMPTPIGEKSFVPNLKDSLSINDPFNNKARTVIVGPQLRIRLDDAFAQKIMNASSTDLENNTNFTQFMKGIHIEVDSTQTAGEGGLMYFDMMSTASKVTIYYSVDTLRKSFSLLINANGVYTNEYSHNYSGTQVQTGLNDSTQGQQKVYVQGLEGVHADIRIPYAKLIKENGPIAINKAELRMKVASGSDNYAVPERMFMVEVSETGTQLSLEDIFFGSDKLGGIYNATDKEYRFDFAVYLQSRVDEEKDIRLRIIPSGAAINANRVVLNGPDATDKMKLVIIYTPLN